MRKPTYYLWRNDFSSQEEFEAERRKYADIGFRVVTFLDGDSNTNIHDGIKALVKNHWDNVRFNQCFNYTNWKLKVPIIYKS